MDITLTVTIPEKDCHHCQFFHCDEYDVCMGGTPPPEHICNLFHVNLGYGYTPCGQCKVERGKVGRKEAKQTKKRKRYTYHKCENCQLCTYVDLPGHCGYVCGKDLSLYKFVFLVGDYGRLEKTENYREKCSDFARLELYPKKNKESIMSFMLKSLKRL